MSEKREHAGRLKGGGDDLSPELKSFEAELASLEPRADRLKRDRLIFLAGQASVARKRSAVAGWASAAAMTTVAATLLAMLLMQPEPRTIQRIVCVPIERAAHRTVVADRDAVPSPFVDHPLEPSAVPEEDISQPVGRVSSWAAIFGWPPGGNQRTIHPQAAYLSQRDRVLSDGPDSWPRAVEAPAQGTERPSRPVLYRELLNSLLDDQALYDPSPDWPIADSQIEEPTHET